MTNGDDSTRIETGVRFGGHLIAKTELRERAARAATGFAALGVGAGDSVALLLRNDLPFLEAVLGAARLGAYAVPINWHLRVEEVAYLMQDCAAKVIVAHADLLPGVAAAMPPGLPQILVPTPAEIRETYGISTSQAAAPTQATAWGVWLAAQAPWSAPRIPFPDSMVYTSGTTGKPKGVRRGIPNAQQAVGMDKLRRQLFGLVPDSRSLVTGPMYHSAPNNFGVQAATYSELTVLMERFDPEEMLALVQRFRITNMFMVPTMFVRLLKLPPEVRSRYDISSLRFVVHSAAPCSPEIKRAMIDWWGPILYEFYGASESGPISFADSTEWLGHPGTVGRILPGATVRVVDAAGNALPRGQIGELYVRQENTAEFSYHNLPEKRKEVELDGLISCGDVGYLDASDFLYVCDRKRDMVISGGVNIYPAEIEAVLINCPGVKDCAVFGIPDTEFGESLMACVEAMPGASIMPSDIRAYLQSHIAGFKVPRKIEMLDALPREDSGKIFKRKLRDPYWEGVGRRI